MQQGPNKFLQSKREDMTEINIKISDSDAKSISKETQSNEETRQNSNEITRTFNKYQGQLKSCFDLIDKINPKGRYQMLIFLVSLSAWFIGGFLILGTGFLFMNVEFDCQSHGLLVQKCKDSVCSLPRSEWAKYQGEKYFESFATEFGPFLCEDEQILHLYTMSVFMGAFMGSVIFSFLADNYGRKFSLLASWGCTCLGLILMCFTVQMWMGVLGIFISGAGGQGTFRNSNLLMTQMVEEKKRQKYLAAVQIFYAFSGAFVGLVYFLVRDWRIITIAFITVPSFIILFVIWKFLEETPKFIIKKPIEEALQIFKKIAIINRTHPGNYITEEDLLNVIEEEQKASLAKTKITTKTKTKAISMNVNTSIDNNQSLRQQKSEERTVNHFDLLRFKSLRIISICCWVISIMMTFLCFGPTLIINSFGLSPFLAQMVICTADVLACLLTFWRIEKFPRVKTGLIFSLISFGCTAILTFVNKPEECHNCWQGIFELVFIFISRFFLSAYFAIFTLHCLQLYPESIRAIGTSMALAVGILSPIAGPFLFSIEGLNTMLIFTVATVLNILAIWFLPETLGKPLKEEIDEMVVPLKESILTTTNNSAQSSFLERIENYQRKLL